MKRFLIIALVLGLVGWGGWILFQRMNQTSGPAQRGGGREKPPVTIEVVKTKQRTLNDKRILTGTAFPLAEFTISSKVGGHLEWFSVNEGDAVQKGQLLGKIEDRVYQQQTQQIQADLKVIRANYDELLLKQRQAERALDRAITLHQKKMLSDEDLENARTELETTHARLRVVQTQVAQKKENIGSVAINLQDTQIRALWPGSWRYHIVSKRHVQAGSTLSPGTPLLTLINIATIRGRIKATETDYARINPGQVVQVTTAVFPDLRLVGKVVRKLPNLDPQTRTGEVEIEIPNPSGKLKPGMFLQAEVVLATHANANVLPNKALVKQGDQEGVFVYDAANSSAKFIPVKLGIQAEEEFEVSSPKIMQPVVTLGNHLLKDGAQVRLAGEKPKETIGAAGKGIRGGMGGMRQGAPGNS